MIPRMTTPPCHVHVDHMTEILFEPAVFSGAGSPRRPVRFEECDSVLDGKSDFEIWYDGVLERVTAMTTN